MTRKHSKQMKKTRSRIPDARRNREPKHVGSGLLERITFQYEGVLRAMPVKDFGSPANSLRGEFVAKRVAEILSRGLQAIFEPDVVKILDKAIREGSIKIEHSCEFLELLHGFVAACLIAGLDSYLKELEQTITRFEDTSIRAAGFAPDEVEILRKLAPEFSGTLDELVETCKAL